MTCRAVFICEKCLRRDPHVLKCDGWVCCSRTFLIRWEFFFACFPNVGSLLHLFHVNAGYRALALRLLSATFQAWQSQLLSCSSGSAEPLYQRHFWQAFLSASQKNIRFGSQGSSCSQSSDLYFRDKLDFYVEELFVNPESPSASFHSFSCSWLLDYTQKCKILV